MTRCELCEREVPETTVHHLTPKQVGRRRGRKVAELPTAKLCRACHRQLHALHDNRTLASLDSVEKLRHDPEVAKFLDWVRRQPGERAVPVRR